MICISLKQKYGGNWNVVYLPFGQARGGRLSA
jgi:hypothetical protein